jgi:hypothetical protein
MVVTVLLAATVNVIKKNNSQATYNKNSYNGKLKRMTNCKYGFNGNGNRAVKLNNGTKFLGLVRSVTKLNNFNYNTGSQIYLTIYEPPQNSRSLKQVPC